MSAFEFDREIDRRPFDSLKWDVAPGELPMWVADMDFETAPAVMEAIARRAAHGTYGYSIVPREWYAAIGQWWQTRLFYPRRVADVLHGGCPCDFLRRAQADHACGAGRDADAGI